MSAKRVNSFSSPDICLVSCQGERFVLIDGISSMFVSVRLPRVCTGFSLCSDISYQASIYSSENNFQNCLYRCYI